MKPNTTSINKYLPANKQVYKYNIDTICKKLNLLIKDLDRDKDSKLLADTWLLISLKGAIIRIGNKIFIAEKRKCYYSSEDYMIFDEYKIDKTKITFNIDPDSGNILQVDFKLNNQIYYYRP